MRQSDRGPGEYDLVVVGGGMGGLATAALAQRAGPAGRAAAKPTRSSAAAPGISRGGPITFDAGATALMGLKPGRADRRPARRAWASISKPSRRPSYRVHLPDRESRRSCPTRPPSRRPSAAVFPGRDAGRSGASGGSRRRSGKRLFARGRARPPAARSDRPGDLVHDLRILGLPGVLAAATSARDGPGRAPPAGPERRRAVPVPGRHALAGHRPGRAGDRPVRQRRGLPPGLPAGDEPAPRGHAGAGRGDRRAASPRLGGDLRTGDEGRSRRAERRGAGCSRSSTRRRHRLLARQVAFNLPLDLAAALLGRSLEGRLGRRERRSRAAWSAFTGYLAIRRDAVPDDAPLFHQVLAGLRPADPRRQQRPDLALAARGRGLRPARCPRGHDVHAHPPRATGTGWTGTVYEREEGRLPRPDARRAAAGHFPRPPDALVHAEFATPAELRRYTRRTAGAVGGPPVSRAQQQLPGRRLGRPRARASGSWATRSSPARGRWPPSSRPSGSSSGSRGNRGTVAAKPSCRDSRGIRGGFPPLP